MDTVRIRLVKRALHRLHDDGFFTPHIEKPVLGKIIIFQITVKIAVYFLGVGTCSNLTGPVVKRSGLLETDRLADISGCIAVRNIVTGGVDGDLVRPYRIVSYIE